MWLHKVILLGCGTLLALCLAVAVAAGPAGASTGNYNGTIDVTGKGYVYADPDIAKITVGVITEGASSTQALGDNADRMSAVVGAVKGLGIPDKDIKTAGVSLEPEYASENRPSTSYVQARQNISGYKATNTVTVTVRDLSKVGPAVDAAGSAGSNEIQGVSFQLSEDSQAAAYGEALQKAIADGTDKARAMAGAAGVSGYRLKTLSESGTHYPVYAENFAAGGGMAKAAAAPTPVSPGHAKVEATVSMVYEFIP